MDGTAESKIKQHNCGFLALRAYVTATIGVNDITVPIRALIRQSVNGHERIRHSRCNIQYLRFDNAMRASVACASCLPLYVRY